MDSKNYRTIKLKNGTIMKGVFNTNREMTEGTITYANGGFRTGKFTDRKLNCEYGEQKYVDYRRYTNWLKGNFTNGKLNGYGAAYGISYDILEIGLFSNNVIVYGTRINTISVFIGGFTHKKLTCDYGVTLEYDGTRRYGRFVDGEINGHGKKTKTKQHRFRGDRAQLMKIYDSIQSIDDIINLMGVDNNGNALYLEYPSSQNILNILKLQGEEKDEEKKTINGGVNGEEKKGSPGLNDISNDEPINSINNQTALINEIKTGIIDRSYEIYIIGCNFSNNTMNGDGICWNDNILYKGHFSNGKLNGKGEYYDTTDKKRMVGTFSDGNLANGKIYINKKLIYDGYFCPEGALIDGVRYEYRPSGLALKYDQNDKPIDDTPERMVALEDKTSMLIEMINKMQAEITTLKSLLAERDLNNEFSSVTTHDDNNTNNDNDNIIRGLDEI